MNDCVQINESGKVSIFMPCSEKSTSDLVNSTIIRLYIPFSDWFRNKKNNARFKINLRMVNTIWFRLICRSLKFISQCAKSLFSEATDQECLFTVCMIDLAGNWFGGKEPVRDRHYVWKAEERLGKENRCWRIILVISIWKRTIPVFFSCSCELLNIVWE